MVSFRGVTIRGETGSCQSDPIVQNPVAWRQRDTHPGPPFQGGCVCHCGLHASGCRCVRVLVRRTPVKGHAAGKEKGGPNPAQPKHDTIHYTLYTTSHGEDIG